MSRSRLRDMYELSPGENPDTTYVDLDQDVPVHLMYMTAWVDQKGNIRFTEDDYGRDKKLQRALFGREA
jgi:murein L,D-transpeptidase YcbB/YkuD